MDQAERRNLEILTRVSERDDVSQRGLAEGLGIALGLANLYLKRLARKGYIKVTTIPANRVRYLLTPAGLAEKTRLTYEYMAYSLQLYRQARGRLRTTLAPLVAGGARRFALYGTGEAAELAYLTLKELGLEPVAVYDRVGGGRFLHLPVQGLDALDPAAFDRLVVASFEPPERHARLLRARGLGRARLIAILDGETGR